MRVIFLETIILFSRQRISLTLPSPWKASFHLNKKFRIFQYEAIFEQWCCKFRRWERWVRGLLPLCLPVCSDDMEAWAKRAEVSSADNQPQLDQRICKYWSGYCTSWCLSFTMCEIWIMIYFFSCERHGDGVFAQTWSEAHGYPCGFHDTSDWSQCKSLKGQFSIKGNWWIRCCPSYKRICFSLAISWFYHSCLGSFWEPLVSLAPAPFAVHLPRQWQARSWEHWIPSCLFISCREKAEVDSWVLQDWWLWCRSAAALTIRHTHQGLPHQGFSLPHPYMGSQQAARMVVQDSWLFWGFEVPSCSLAF